MSSFPKEVEFDRKKLFKPFTVFHISLSVPTVKYKSIFSLHHLLFGFKQTNSELAVIFERAKRVCKEDQQRGLEEGKEIPKLCFTAAKIDLHSEE